MITAISLVLLLMSGYIIKLLWPLRVYKRLEFEIIIFCEVIKFVGLMIIFIDSLVVHL